VFAARSLLSSRLVPVAALVVALAGCAHQTTAPAEAQLDAARVASQGVGDAAVAISWSDAVAVALRAGVTVDEGDTTDAVNRLRAAQAAAFGADIEPIAAARARLLTALGKTKDADAAWVEAARSLPTPANLQGMFDAAKRTKDKARLRALCAVGPVALLAGELARWLDRCAQAAELDQAVASALWLATDRARLQSGTDPVATTPVDVCLQRCRPAIYRAVAACPGGDDQCLQLASHAFDVCETNCREMP